MKPEGNNNPHLALRRRALGLLARREHSVQDLRDKLRGKEAGDGEALAAVLGALIAEGLLSDQRFAEAFIGSRRERGQGPLRIEAELRRRGIGGEMIAAFLEVEDTAWQIVASGARRKRFGNATPGDFSERARQARFLRSRGFTEGQVRGALEDDGLS